MYCKPQWPWYRLKNHYVKCISKELCHLQKKKWASDTNDKITEVVYSLPVEFSMHRFQVIHNNRVKAPQSRRCAIHCNHFSLITGSQFTHTRDNKRCKRGEADNTKALGWKLKFLWCRRWKWWQYKWKRKKKSLLSPFVKRAWLPLQFCLKISVKRSLSLCVTLLYFPLLWTENFVPVSIDRDEFCRSWWTGSLK